MMLIFRRLQLIPVLFWIFAWFPNDAICGGSSLELVDISGCSSFLTLKAWHEDVSNELPLVPGSPRYYPDIGFSAGKPRFNDLYLDVASLQSLEQTTAVSKTLAIKKTFTQVQNLIQEAHSSGIKKISLAQFLPDAVEERHENYLSPWGEGPNCFNATLSWHQTETGIEHTSSTEIDELLKLNFIELKPEDHLKLGDVIAIYSYVGDRGNFRLPWSPNPDEPRGALGVSIMHTAIYLNHEFVWHKASNWPFDPWTFESLEQVLSVYLAEYHTSHGKGPGRWLGIKFYRFRREA